MTPGDDTYRPCVGVVLCNAAGLVFAGERADMPGAWQMPQGGIDPGETAEAAGLRELLEETSVPADAVVVVAETVDWVRYDLPPEIRKKRWGGRYIGQRQKWLLCRLEADDAVIDLATDHPEFGRWRWMHPAELLDAIVPFKRPVYERVFAEFQPYLAGAAAQT